MYNVLKVFYSCTHVAFRGFLLELLIVDSGQMNHITNVIHMSTTYERKPPRKIQTNSGSMTTQLCEWNG
eukprot:m.223237 g.223237  ORF g.223237 m.223237 type:complete len:69 (-) comp15138_c0_seq2:89-295(-)